MPNRTLKIQFNNFLEWLFSTISFLETQLLW